MAEMDKVLREISDEELDAVAGGKANPPDTKHHWTYVKCVVKTNYLALRTKAEYKRENEIAEIWPNEKFYVRYGKRSGAYVWADYKHKQGWVNGDYIMNV